MRHTVGQVRESVDKLRNVCRDVVVLSPYERPIQLSSGTKFGVGRTSSQKLSQFSYCRPLSRAANSLSIRTWCTPVAGAGALGILPAQFVHDERGRFTGMGFVEVV